MNSSQNKLNSKISGLINLEPNAHYISYPNMHLNI